MKVNWEYSLNENDKELILFHNRVFFYRVFFLFFITLLWSCTESVDNIDPSNPIAITCFTGGNVNMYGLKITEISAHWIEVHNTNQGADASICLADYKLKVTLVSTDTSQTTATTSEYKFSENQFFPNNEIKPGEYSIIRFLGVAKNSSTKMLIYPQSQKKVVAVDLIRSNDTIDFTALCASGRTVPVASPTTGTFTGCIPTAPNTYGSYSLDENYTDNNRASDWTFRDVTTFGGKNDVTDITDGDKDGIPDANEQQGSTFAGMPLYDWGARAGVKDIFVHVNYMDNASRVGFTPFKGSFDKMKSVFAANQYALHFDLGTIHSPTFSTNLYNLSGSNHAVPYNFFVDIRESANAGPNTTGVKSIISYKNEYLPINRFGIFHYALIADTLSDNGTRSDNTLGIAELPGNDFLVFTGSETQSKLIASFSDLAKQNYFGTIFMHEFGHNLDLGHGGHEHENYKPNYFSIMNYSYTTEGVPKVDSSSRANFQYRYYRTRGATINANKDPIGLAQLDNNLAEDTFNMTFSSGTRPDLNESALSQANPLGPGIGNIDWNLNGNFDAIVISANINPKWNTTKSTLKDNNDWANLQLPFNHTITGNGYGNLSFFGAESEHSIIANLTVENSQPNLPPHGSRLVAKEGGSPYIIDMIPLPDIVADQNSFDSSSGVSTNNKLLLLEHDHEDDDHDH